MSHSKSNNENQTHLLNSLFTDYQILRVLMNDFHWKFNYQFFHLNPFLINRIEMTLFSFFTLTEYYFVKIESSHFSE